MIHLTWKFPFLVYKRCSLLIWLSILLVLYIYFNWEKRFTDIIWVKRKSGLLLCVSILCARARVCVCLRPFYPACVCLRPFTVTASSVGNNWNAKEQIKNVALKTFLSSAKSLHFYFRLKHQTFLTSPLSCSHTRSRQSHDLASVHLAFKA